MPAKNASRPPNAWRTAWSPRGTQDSERKLRPTDTGSTTTFTDYLTCKRVFELLDDYLDRELGPTDLAAVRRHLETCAHCAAEVRFEQNLLRQVRGKLARIVIPAGLHAQVWEVVMRGYRGSPGDDLLS